MGGKSVGVGAANWANLPALVLEVSERRPVRKTKEAGEFLPNQFTLGSNRQLESFRTLGAELVDRMGYDAPYRFSKFILDRSKLNSAGSLGSKNAPAIGFWL